MTFRWTDHNIATLRQMASEKHSARVIAAHIGAPSRSAVLGKAWRLKIQMLGAEIDPVKVEKRRVVRLRAEQNRVARERRAAELGEEQTIRRARTGPRLHTLPMPVLMGAAIEFTARPWITRERGECAFPVSGEGADTMSCCNRTKGETYCPGHKALMSAEGYGSFSMARIAKSALWAGRQGVAA